MVFGIASIISSICFGLVPTKRKEKLEKQERKILTLLKDIDSFYSIESALVEELCALTGKNQKSTKDDIRKQVRIEKNYTISDFSTPSNLQKEISRYEDR